MASHMNNGNWLYRFRSWLAGLISPYKCEWAGTQLNKWSTSKPYRHWSCFRSSFDFQKSQYTCELVWTSINPIVSVRFTARTPQDARQKAADWLVKR